MSANSSGLSAEALLRQYQLSGDMALRETLVRMHLYIAGIVARRFTGRGVDYEDLYQVASLALVKAIERFEPDKGVKFVSYATPTMVGEVKNYFRDKARPISVPRRGAELIARIQKAMARLQMDLMRNPTPVELAEELDVSLEMVLEALEMQGAMSPASLDTAPAGEDESPISAFLGVEEKGFALFEQSDQVKRLLEKLPRQQRDVLTMRYFGGKSQREIAQFMDVSQMTISRLERKALETLKSWMTEEDG